MKPGVLVLLAALAALAAPVAAAGQSDDGDVVASGAELQLVADGFGFTEGPAADKNGDVFFSDQPNDRIMKWSAVDGAVTLFLSPSGRANGLFFDRDGQTLLAAADGGNELWSIAPDGSRTVLARRFDGKEYNGPNDLWVHPRTGAIYFTDPLYPRKYWTHRTAESQQDGQHVYRLDRGTGEVGRIAETGDLRQPNGIVGTPDGRILYVADIGAGKTWAYRVRRDGTLKNRRLLAPMGSDGMTIDSRGNVYLTGRGVTVFNPRGERIAHIDVPGGWTANVCFGGSGRNILFITASKAVYTLEMNVAGVK